MINSIEFKGKDYEAGEWLHRMMKATEIEFRAEYSFTPSNVSITLTFDNVPVRKLLRRLNKLLGVSK